MSLEAGVSLPPPAVRRLWSVVILLTFGLQVGLIVRTHRTDDDRFGFAMFHEYASYYLSYRWIPARGAPTPYKPPANHLTGWANKIDGRGRRDSIMGLGATRSNIQAYLEWLHDHHLPRAAVAVEAIWTYKHNGSERDVQEILRHPPQPPSKRSNR